MMSPIIYGVGGEIEKYYTCRLCGTTTTKVENFISLSFKRLLETELIEIRTKFSNEGYTEGIKFDESDKQKRGMIDRLLGRKKEDPKPVTTIRDYLCHLNMLQREISS